MSNRILKLVAAVAASLLPIVLVGFLAMDANASGTTQLEGVYLPMHYDGGPRKGQEMHYLKTKNGTFELDFDGVRAPRPGAQIVVEGQAASATGFEVQGVRTIAASEVASTGTVNALVITLRWGNSVPTATPAQAQSFVLGTQATSTASWLRDASFGKLTLQGTATPVLTIADPGACVSRSTANAWLTVVQQRAATAATNAGYNLANYPIRIINTPASLICETRGWGSASGYTWIANGLYNASQMYERYIIAHEVGHNFALAHSHGLECGASTVTAACLGTDQSNNEYGDILDTMGNSSPLNGLAMYNAQQMARVRWLPRAAQTVTSNGTYTVSPLEHANPTYAPALTINTATRSYTVELRQALGVDSFMDSLAGVLVHMRNDLPGGDTGSQLLDMTPGSTALDFSDAALTVGRTFTALDNAFTLKVLSVGGTGATVQVTFAGTSVGDTTPPVMSAISQGFPLGQQITNTTAPVQLSWSATDNVGVSAYEVYWSTNNGTTWTQDASAAANATSIIRWLGFGGTYRYAVRARDAAGNWSGYAYNVPATPSVTDDKAFTIASPWARYNLADTHGGTYAGASQAGAWLQHTFTGRTVAFVAPKFSTAGRATIYCDGALYKTVDLYSATTVGRQVIEGCLFAQSAQHTIKIVVQGTSGRPWVGVDAFTVLA
jgi:hypothetical protein